MCVLFSHILEHLNLALYNSFLSRVLYHSKLIIFFSLIQDKSICFMYPQLSLNSKYPFLKTILNTK